MLGDGHLSPKEFIQVMEKRKDGGYNEVRSFSCTQMCCEGRLLYSAVLINNMRMNSVNTLAS